MRKSIRIPAVIALSLALTVPALAQSTHPQNAPAQAPAEAAKAAPTVDPNKAYLLHEEYVAQTAALRGQLTAKKAQLETQLATKPDDTAAIKKLVAEIASLRGQLDEQTVLFRIRYAKETGTPLRQTLHLGDGHDGMMAGMGQGGMDCMMMGKGKGQGMMMDGMDHGAMEHGPANAPAPAAPTPPAAKP